MGKSYVTKKNLFKFLLGSAFGILMFLVPIPQGESFTTLLDFLKSWIKGLFGSNLSYIITVMLVFSAVVSVLLQSRTGSGKIIICREHSQQHHCIWDRRSLEQYLRS